MTRKNPTAVLFLDVGTTHTHWALDRNGTTAPPAASGATGSNATDWSGIATSVAPEQPSHVVACSVKRFNADHCRQALREMFPRSRILWYAAQPEYQGLLNAYSRPQSLGADRWHAMIAARHLTDDDMVVIDAGSAITVDYVTSAGRHLGGMIAPGAGMLRTCLAIDAALGESVDPNNELPAKDTATACGQGIEAMLEGIRAKVRAQLELRFDGRAKVLVTGGDARLFERVAPDTVHCPDLVLDGLRLRFNTEQAGS